MSRCRCDPISVAGCQCHFDHSDCIAIYGSGSEANPHYAEPIFDPDETNLASCGVGGLLVQLPALWRDPPRVKVHRTTNQLIPGDDTQQAIEFNYTFFDVGGWFDPSGDTTAITVPVDGLYEVKFHVSMEPQPDVPGADDAFRVTVYKNLTDAIVYETRWSSPAGSNIGTRLRDSTRVELEAGDTLYLIVQNNTSVDLNSSPFGGLDNLLEVYYVPMQLAA